MQNTRCPKLEILLRLWLYCSKIRKSGYNLHVSRGIENMYYFRLYFDGPDLTDKEYTPNTVCKVAVPRI